MAFLGSVSAASLSAQIKVEAESATKMHSLKTNIKLENSDKTVGYFDEAGEYMTYEVQIPETGLYQFSFSYLTGKDGDLKIEGPDGGTSVFPIAANHATENWWDLPMNSWPQFDFEESALFYFEAGTQTFIVHNTGWALNLDYFQLKKSSVTDNKVVSVKTNPKKVELMPNEQVQIIPSAYNAAGQKIAAAATWSSNAPDGVYKAGGSLGADVVTVTMSGVEKSVNVKIAKPEKKQEFVVSKYGALNTNNGAVRDAGGNKVSLMGPSFFWSCSAPLWWTKETVNFLVKNYNIQVIRLPVSIAPGDNTWVDNSATWNEDNYLHRPDYTRALVDEMVKAAIENEALVAAFMKSSKSLEEAIAFLESETIEKEDVPKPKRRHQRQRSTLQLPTLSFAIESMEYWCVVTIRLFARTTRRRLGRPYRCHQLSTRQRN